jgi:hypothetical protein
MKRALVVLAGLLVAIGCKETIDVKNGEVPNEYRDQAIPYMGTYKGKIEGEASEISLSLNGNKVVLSGSQPVNSRCQTSYGDLKSIVVEKDGNNKITVHGANFAFNPGNCAHAILGREVNLSFKGNKIYYSLLFETRREWRCGLDVLNPTQVPPVPPPPNPPPCYWEYVDIYIQGSLRK